MPNENSMSIVTDAEFALVRDDYHAVNNALVYAKAAVSSLERRRDHLLARIHNYQFRDSE